jgi:hypothetical protein
LVQKQFEDQTLSKDLPVEDSLINNLMVFSFNFDDLKKVLQTIMAN